MNIEEQIQQFITEARALRAKADEAEVDFLLFVQKGESAVPWQSGGFASFDELLKRGNVCEPARYRTFVAAVERLGLADVREIGVHAAVEFTRVAAKKGVDPKPAVEHAKAWVAENKTTMPAQTAQRVVLRELGPISPARVMSRATRVRELERENARLERENAQIPKAKSLQERVRELETENAKLTRENEKLRHRVAELEGKKPPRSVKPRPPAPAAHA